MDYLKWLSLNWRAVLSEHKVRWLPRLRFLVENDEAEHRRWDHSKERLFCSQASPAKVRSLLRALYLSTLQSFEDEDIMDYPMEMWEVLWEIAELDGELFPEKYWCTNPVRRIPVGGVTCPKVWTSSVPRYAERLEDAA